MGQKTFAYVSKSGKILLPVPQIPCISEVSLAEALLGIKELKHGLSGDV